MEGVRHPFVRTISGQAQGTVQHRGGDAPRRMRVELGFAFRPDGSEAKATLEDGSSCRMVWQHGQKGSAQIVEQSPNASVSLVDFGIHPEDLTFSFLFWKPVEEKRRDTVSGQPCRVIRLEHPDSGATVLGWFSEKFRFPLRLEWTPAGEDGPTRVCEFTRFKQQEDGTWFIRSLRIYGKGWKTKLTLDGVTLDVGE
jgi:hypothetical protein